MMWILFLAPKMKGPSLDSSTKWNAEVSASDHRLEAAGFIPWIPTSAKAATDALNDLCHC